MVTASERPLTFKQTVSLAVITGLFGAGAGLGGAWLTGISERSVAKEQFSLDQRAEAYAAFSGAAEDLLRVERNASMLFEPRQDIPSQTDGQDEIDALGDTNVKLQTAAARVRIAGPKEVSAKSDAIVKNLEAMSDAYFVGFSRLNPKPSSNVLAEVKAKADPLYGRYYELKEEFLDSTETALGS